MYGPIAPESDEVLVRDVALLPGETISHVFTSDLGLTQEPPANGQLLIATSQRLLAFCQDDGRNETYIVPLEDLRSVAVKSRSRSVASLMQGALLVVGGLFVYVVAAYWLTGRFDGPTIPGLRMDLSSFLVLLVFLAGMVVMGRYYFGSAGGTVTFLGSNWSFAFACRGDRATQEIYQVVNGLFSARRSYNGRAFPWED